MTTKLLVIYPYVSAYRVPFFNRLEAALAQHDVQLVVTRNGPPPSMARRGDMSDGQWAVDVPTSWLTLGGQEIPRRRIGSIMREFQPDLVVVEQALHNPETYLLLARHAAGRYGVATWGHGRSCSSTQSAPIAALKQWLTRRGDWFFAYTQSGADHVVAHGFPRARVSVLNNTIDTERLRADLDVVEPDELHDFRRAQGLTSGRTALFLGRVDEKKGIGFLLESAKLAGELMPGFVLLIAGCGDSVPMVRAAQTDGVPVRLLGRTHGLAKALALSATDVLAIPEQVGLVAVDALVSGRPIIVTDHSMYGPEFDYLVPGETTIVTTHVVADYAHALVSALSAPDRLADMQAAALHASYRYTLDGMVDSFVEGVLAWRDLRRAGLTTRTRPLGSAQVLSTHPQTEKPLLAVLMTCHNRRKQTLRCLGALRGQDLPNVDLRVYLTDDGSTDGTGAAISTVDLPIRVVAGGGELYWAAGMAMAERAAMGDDPDLLLWLNDDVTLDPDGLAALMAVHEQSPEAIVVGTVRDPDTSGMTYGGRNRRGRHPQRFSSVPQADQIQGANAFNGNVVLIPRSARNIVGPIDGSFAHAYADDDYSLRASKLCVPILCAAGTVGICSPNPAGAAPTSVRASWNQLQAPKGLPWRSQVRYLRRHGGLLWPAYLAWGYGKAITRAGVRMGASSRRELAAPDPPRLAQEPRMKIVFLELRLDTYRVPFLVELLRHGDIGVIAVDFAAGTREALESAGVVCLQLDSISIARTWVHPQGFREPNPVTLVRGVRRHLVQLQPDVIIAADLSIRVLQALVYARLRRPSRRPRVFSWARVSEHSERGRGRVQGYLRPWLLGATDGVIANGHSGVRYLEGIGVEARKIHQIFQATDPRVVGLSSVKAHVPLRLLFVGRLVELKGLSLLLEEMAKASKPDVILRIVGVGPQLAALQQQALRLKLNVVFAGYCQGAELGAQYAESDYFVFPSLSDEWGLVINEALASGLPVLGSVYSQAVNELIHDGVNGWLFRPDCPGQLAYLISSLSGIDVESRKRLRKNALVSAKQVSPCRIVDLFAEAIGPVPKSDDVEA